MRYDPYTDRFYDETQNPKVFITTNTTCYFCKEKGRPCVYANATGFCQITACLVREEK